MKPPSKPIVALDARLGAGRPALETFARVIPLTPRETGGIAGADALLVASTTRVDARLLDAAPRVRLVATASSGTDHLDLEALATRGIAHVNAAGGNAQAVADWVEVALSVLGAAPTTVGIVGVGHVGRAVHSRLARLGWRCLLNDPPRAAREPGFPSQPLERLLEEAYCLTLHVPLEPSTRHLLGRAALARFKGRTILQASRGGVLEEAAFPELGARGVRVACDVFEGEPAPLPATVAAARFATPHLAGHTDHGRRALITAALFAVARHFGRDPRELPPVPLEPTAGAAEDVLRRAHARLRAGEPFAQIRAESVRLPLHPPLANRPQDVDGLVDSRP